MEPGNGSERVLIFHVYPLKKKWAKFGSSAISEYCKFCLQLSKLLKVSFLVRDQCIGSLCMPAITVCAHLPVQDVC